MTGNTGSSDFLTDGGKLNVRGEGRVSVAASDDGAKDSKLTLEFDDTNLVKLVETLTVDEHLLLMVELLTQSTLLILLLNMTS